MRIQCLLFGLSIMLVSTQLGADMLESMEKALMPGELSDAHAEFEADCTQCHKFFQKSFQNDLCLNCHDHKNIRDDIDKKQGYHGRIPGINIKECKTCHREHIGRAAKIVFLDLQTFDHSLTDYPLKGKHKDTSCVLCHKEDKPYHQTPNVCVDCHKKNQPHEGRLGKKCDQCHRESSWQDFVFDHDQTDFKLVGRHQSAQCRNCHPRDSFRDTPEDCYSCHINDDAHNGRFDKKCKNCHRPDQWTTIRFDHDKDTDYKLDGQHKQVGCEQCHTANPYKEDTSDKCIACHKYDDEHKGSFGEECEDCHNTKAWKKESFNHDDTDFPLKGKHLDVTCKACHASDIHKELDTQCYACHREDDVHKGEQGKQCNECHNEEGWSKKVEFDHNLVRFPLLGAHIALACEECHTSNDFKDANPKCRNCHHDADVHKEKLGPNCGYCHVSNDWRAWQFDHDKQTEFKLVGKHKNKDCLLCHREKPKGEIDLSTTCYSCHADDDEHDGEFGRICDRCHNEKSFGELKL